ncbi:MAG: sensor histidine kinase, partial [Coprococcus sp.]|nr:sensor histidine kinase [Coprococcus sp.]
IVKNAMEHSPKEGDITIDSGVNPMYDWIAVTDSGIGLRKEQYATLFKRFENSTTENGFGIGMPLALSIMKGQNGDIDVELGGNGKGATFLLKFFK